MTTLYASTNESLDAIMASMELNESDSVLTVLGSGDQALAMLEYGCNVVAVERDLLQGAYAMEMIRTLENADYKKFFSDYRYEYGTEVKYMARNSYFSKKGRLGKIRNKLRNLQVRQGDILELPEEGAFSKVYLSNALGYDSTIKSIEAAQSFMDKLAAKLRKPGLVYITGKEPETVEPGSLFITYDTPIRCPEDFMIDKKLTKKARAREKSVIPWMPYVLRRKA